MALVTGFAQLPVNTSWYNDTKKSIAQDVAPNFSLLGLHQPVADGFTALLLPYDTLSWDMETNAQDATAHLGGSMGSTGLHNLDTYAIQFSDYPYTAVNMAGPVLSDYNGNIELSWFYALWQQLSLIYHTLGSPVTGRTYQDIPYLPRAWDWAIESMSMTVAHSGINCALNLKVYGQQLQNILQQSQTPTGQQHFIPHFRIAKWYNTVVQMGFTNTNGLLLNQYITPTSIKIDWEFQKSETYNLASPQGGVWAGGHPFADAPIIYYKKLITKISLDGYINPTDSDGLPTGQGANLLSNELHAIVDGSTIPMTSIQIDVGGRTILSSSAGVIPLIGEAPQLHVGKLSLTPNPDGLTSISMNGMLIFNFSSS